MTSRVLQRLVLAALVLLLAAGLYRIFELRFAAGDIFPPSSSRRADPIGSRALFDALARQHGLRVSRNLLPLPRLQHRPGLAVLVLGVAPEHIGDPSDATDFNSSLLRLAQGGARVVLAAQHESSALATNALRQGIRSLARTVPAKRPQASLCDTLGFGLAQGASSTSNAAASPPLARRRAASPGLPDDLPWPSPWRITGATNGWTVLYEADGQPVVVQRAWDQGSVVVVASDYLLSNEALRRVPQPAFIAALLSDATQVVFDETHLGLTFEPGMASLVRRYQLGGAVAGLAVLAGLYLWRNLARFNPPPPGPPPDDALAGRGTAEAFRALLRRAARPETLVAECMERWRDSQGRHPRVGPRRVADAQDVLDIEMERPPKERNPVQAYRRIAAILHHRIHR
ncbi:MAG: DUF4350 domain-containing protein [Verrucomicrobiota bacterium]|jgi:hypothetical protein